MLKSISKHVNKVEPRWFNSRFKEPHPLVGGHWYVYIYIFIYTYLIKRHAQDVSLFHLLFPREPKTASTVDRQQFGGCYREMLVEAVELNNLQKPRILWVFLEVGKMGSALLSLVVFASGLKTVLTNCACLYTLMTYVTPQNAHLWMTKQQGWRKATPRKIESGSRDVAQRTKKPMSVLPVVCWMAPWIISSQQFAPLARRWRAGLHLAWHLCYVVCCPGLVTFQWLGPVSSDHTLWNSCGLSKQRWPRAGTSPL